MRQIDSRLIAVAGVLVAAVLAACLILPAVGQLATLETTWLAAAILCGPSAAVLVVTGYRHYGWARSAAVAVTIMLITGLISWVVTVFAFAEALSGETSSPVMAVVLFGTPALSVVVLGLLALRLVPGRSTADRQFEHAGRG
ncbi:MAG TPA: hypothetical protein VHI10_13630 [Mycobacterium sp.]|nr:hypothetical protein [Mycobacterium sp.]